jgi:hypothetical protein
MRPEGRGKGRGIYMKVGEMKQGLTLDESMTIGEIYEKLQGLKQEIFDKLSEIGKITVPYGMKIEEIRVPFIEVTELGEKSKTYIIGVPQFESEIVFPKSIMEDLK